MRNVRVAERHHALDLIRGLAALGIAIYHRMAWKSDVYLDSLGTFGVYLFFILSALTMMLVYERTFAGGIAFDDALTFFRNRASRIFPLLLLVAVIWFAYSSVTMGYDPALLWRAVLTGTGLMALTPPGFTSTVTGAWSLAIELQFYLILPLLTLCFARLPLRFMCIICAIAVAAQQAYLFTISGHAEYWTLYVNPITFAPFFLMGFLIYKAGPKKLRGATALSLSAFLIISLYSLAWPGDTKQFGFWFLGLTILAFASVYFAYRSQLPAHFVALASLLGNMSYGVYLIHPFISLLTDKVAELFDMGAGLLTFSTYLAMVFVGALALYYGFEKPARQIFRAKPRAISTLP